MMIRLDVTALPEGLGAVEKVETKKHSFSPLSFRHSLGKACM